MLNLQVTDGSKKTCITYEHLVLLGSRGSAIWLRSKEPFLRWDTLILAAPSELLRLFLFAASCQGCARAAQSLGCSQELGSK